MILFNKLNSFWEDLSGDAIVEASILFPIIIMIFAALVLLSMYLPIRARLQYATQYAATAIATEGSDTWLFHDESSMSYGWKTEKNDLDNVYISLIKSSEFANATDRVDTMIRNIEEGGIGTTTESLTVDYGFINYIIYKEIIVTATSIIPVPVDLSFIGFPKEIPITVTSTAVVQNGDEFVRNMDIAVDFVEYIDGKYEISKVFGSVGDFFEKFTEILGWE